MKICNKIKKTGGLNVIICLILFLAFFYEVSSDSILWKNIPEFQKEVQSQTFSSLERKNITKFSFVQVLKQKTSHKNNILRRYKRITIIVQAGVAALSLWRFFILSIRFPNSKKRSVIWKNAQSLAGKRAPPILSCMEKVCN